MWRLIFWFIVVAALAWGATWLAAQPGTISLEWLGWHVEMPVALAVALLLIGLLLAWLAFRLLRFIVGAPFAASDFLRRRRRHKAREALSMGLAALVAGDVAAAERATRKALMLAPENPLAKLLRAQALLISGSQEEARFRFRQMLDNPETEPAGLHGLYDLALQEGNMEAARLLAEKAWRRYPQLAWAARAMLKYAALEEDWPRVRALLTDMRQAGIIDKAEERRLKAVALAAEALALEEENPDAALQLALKAHKLDPALVPAAVAAGRLLAARGKTRKARKVLEVTWQLAPHVDIAEVYAHLRPGDSPRERLERVQQLLRKSDGGEEGAVALARAAIDAQAWDVAMRALRPLIDDRPSARVFLLLAELEEKRSGDIGRMREWLRRARTARPDPAWVAGSIVSSVWLPVTPDGVLGAFEWKEPPVVPSVRPALGEPVPAELLEAPAAATAETAEEAATEEATPEEEARPSAVSVASAKKGDKVGADGGKAEKGEAETPEVKTRAQAGEDALAKAEAIVDRPAGRPGERSASESAGGSVERPAEEAAGEPVSGKTPANASKSAPRAAAMPARAVANAAEAVAELPEEEFSRPPLPDDPGLPRKQ